MSRTLSAEWGLGAALSVNPTLINIGEVWQFDIASDKPVSPQQFFDLVASFQGEMIGKTKTLSFSAIDQTHFRTIDQFLQPQAYRGPGDSQVVDGIKFTITDGKPYVETQTVADENGLSKGEMVGIGVVGATALGTVIYLATRKKPRRRRRS